MSLNKIYTQGIMSDGACILKNGEPMTIDEIVETLNDYEDKLDEMFETIEEFTDEMY